jgi:hypothetical protein
MSFPLVPNSIDMDGSQKDGSIGYRLRCETPSP